MISFKRLACLAVALAVAWVGACKPPEPTPSQYTNLGTEEAPLLPPPQAWHDPSIEKGSSEWRPFRKPPEGEPKSAAGKAQATAAANTEENPAGTAGSPDAEKEIRNLVADFNAALAENKLDEAAEFLTDAQAAASGDVFAAVHQLIEQLRLLQAATQAVTEKIDAIVPLLNISDTLKVEVQSVRLVDAKNATAALAGGSEAKFVVGEEDFWYIESPVLAVLDKERPRIQKMTKEIEEALAKGTPDESAATALGAALDDLRAALSPSSGAQDDSG